MLTRDSVFDRVYVDYAIRGTARISWSLRARFIDPGPHIFQLQASRSGGDTWEDVGAEAENTSYALDDTRRLYGQDMRLIYRVRLTTPVNEYVSGEATILGKLTRRQWLQAREIVRQISLDSRGMECFEGFLLKRKIEGDRCTMCLDRMTNGIKNSDCSLCKGTGYVDGYFVGIKAIMYELSPTIRETHNRRSVGTITDGAVLARYVGLPLVHNRDVWVDANSDRRYMIGNVQHISEMNQIPLAITAELRPLEFSDIAFTVPTA